MNANATLLQKKYARIIELYAKKCGVSTELALKHFYHSNLYQLISTGVSDMHCMSDDYLAEELQEEWSESRFYHVAIAEIQDDCIVVFFSANESIKMHVSSEIVLNKEGKRIGSRPRPNRLISITSNSFVKQEFKYQNGEQPAYVQFIVRDETHQEQHSIVFCVVDKHVLAKRMRYKEICDPYDYTEWE